MSYYGGTVTVKGRNLITSLIAGETIELTRIMVGTGAMPEGVEPIDMTDLVSPIAEATSTVPIVEDEVLRMTVEYRNDLNGGLKEGFWLREFGIYAKTENSEEILLYYATLGDSPQPVNAYKDNRIDIRRYPLVIALAFTDDVEVKYDPGSFVTAGEVDDLVDSKVKSSVSTVLSDVGFVVLRDIVIPASGWKSSTGTGEWLYSNDVSVEEIKETHSLSIDLRREDIIIAENAGVCPSVQSLDRIVRLWAVNKPSSDLQGQLKIFTKGGGFGSGVVEPYELPIATETTLGGIMIGKGMKITREGVLTPSDDNISQSDVASDEEIDEILKKEFGDIK